MKPAVICVYTYIRIYIYIYVWVEPLPQLFHVKTGSLIAKLVIESGNLQEEAGVGACEVNPVGAGHAQFPWGLPVPHGSIKDKDPKIV